MNWKQYVVKTSGSDVNRVIAHKLGVTEPSVARWKNGETKSPDAKQAAAFARAYDRPVIEAFVAAGFLTAEEAKVRPAAAPDLTTLTNEELLTLVRSRMREQAEVQPDAGVVRGPRLLPTAALDAGHLSRGQRDRLAADQAGEPVTDDPDDMEPR